MIDTGLSAGAKQGVGARTQINVSWTLECSPWFFALDAPEQEEITMRGPVIRFFFFRLSNYSFTHSPFLKCLLPAELHGRWNTV